METNYFLGIDISKKKLDAALTVDGKHFHEVQIDNQTKAIGAFFSSLKKQISSLTDLVICAEHTGVYGLLLLEAAVERGIRICVEPARQIILSQGITRGKSDKLDAKRIALYAFKNRESLSFWKPQRECVQELKALLVNRERLIRVKAELQVPLKEFGDFISSSLQTRMIRCNKASIKAIEKDIRQIEQAIDELVKSDAELSEQSELATSVPGIGTIVACHMIIASGEFKRIREAKKFACYAGVAPFEHQSGSSIRGRTRVSKTANLNMKRLLHLASMVAVRFNDELKTYYQRKVELGKNKMSVLNAVRNKLISRVYVCITQKRKYEKNYPFELA
jgi:transposase